MTATRRVEAVTAAVSAAVIAAAMTLGSSGAAAGRTFDDVDANAYYGTAVMWLAAQELTTGTAATTFSPDRPLTRAELAAFLSRFAQADTQGLSTPFVDVPEDRWFAGPIGWLHAEGITTGTSEATFSPHTPVTRAQLATFIWRFAGSPPPGSLSAFDDVPASAFYAEAVGWLASKGLTTGTSPSTFSPDAQLTRAQLATFLWRLAGEPRPSEPGRRSVPTADGAGRATGQPAQPTTTTSVHPSTTGALPPLTPMPSTPTTAAPTTTAQPKRWEAWVSSPFDIARRLERVRATTEPADVTIEVTVENQAQLWRGVGAALTDSSLALLQTEDSLEVLFDPRSEEGARLNLLRLPTSSSDFSTTYWSSSWDTATGFAPARQAADAATFITNSVLPLRPDLGVVTANWSAPPSMKTSGSLLGGSLAETATADYGEFLVAQARWLQDAGVPLVAISLGNEPRHSVDTYPTMAISVPQQVALASSIGTRLRQAGTELWAVDHNWEHWRDYAEVEEGSPGAFSAAAWHCYSSTAGISNMARVSLPGIITECTGTNDSWASTYAWDARNLVVEPANSGSTGLLMWNLALDENSGPKLPGGCTNCRGLLQISDGHITPGPEFFTLALVARAGDANSRVVPVSANSDLVAVAFANPDGSVGVFGHNPATTERVVAVQASGLEEVRFSIGPGELFALRGAAAG